MCSLRVSSVSQQPLPKITRASLSVVLTTRNVAANLPKLVEEWLGYLGRLKRDYELILVDDASTDGTADAADAIAAANPKVRVLRQSEPHGNGACLRAGIGAARHRLLFYSSADGTYRPADLGRLLGRLPKVHLVSGYRAGLPVPASLRVLGGIWRWMLWLLFGISVLPLPGWLGRKPAAYQKLIRALFGVRVGDIDSMCKLFRREVFERIPIQSDGAFVHAEVLAKANFAGYLMEEIAIPVPAMWESDSRRWAEMRRVFRSPDFGPAILSKSKPADSPA
jgi:glycosyltransferase involved in cell wall biosynthesis